MIPLEQVKIIGSAPEIMTWPATGRLTHFGVVPNRMTIQTTGTDNWPSISPDPHDRDGQAGTLGIFLNIDGQWCLTGAERLRKYQLNGNKPVADPAQGGLSTLVGQGWLFDAARWPMMAGHNPQPGEHVGFVVFAGSVRSDHTVTVRERTQVIETVWPPASGADPFEIVWEEGEPLPRPPLSPKEDLKAILEAIEALRAEIKALREKPAPNYVGTTTLAGSEVSIVLKPGS